MLAATVGSKPAAFTAAARIIDLTSEREKSRTGQRRPSEWQNDAWGYYDLLPEAKRGAQFKERSLGKLEVFLGYRPTSSEPLVPAASADGVPADALAIAQNITERIAGSDEGFSGLLARWGAVGFVVGEAFLVTWDDPDNAGGIVARVVTLDELRLNGRREWCIADEPTAKEDAWERIPDGAIMVRIWNKHARYGQLADSSLRGVLDVCEQLALLQGLGIGSTMSRMNNGMLAIPDTMLAVRPRVSALREGEAEPHHDVVVDKLMEHIITPIGEFRSAAAAAPYVVTGSPEDIKAIRHITFTREGANPDDVERLVRRFANGIDLPAEVIVGIADVNHWTAWLVDDQTYRAHVEPDATEFLRATAQDVLHPMMRAAGVPPDVAGRFWYGQDASALVEDPDETETTFKAWAEGLLGSEGARQRLRIGEDEKPTPEDLETLRIVHGRTSTTDETVDVVEGPPPGDDVGDAITASVMPAELVDRITSRWVDRDRALRVRLLTMADAAMSRALDRAGAQLRTRTRGQAMYRDATDGVSNRQLAAQLGPAVVRRVLAQDDDTDVEALLFAGAWDELAARWDQLTAAAQSQVRRELAELGVDPETIERLAERQTDDRSRGRRVLVAALGAIAVGRLWNPAAPVVDAGGEADTTGVVPAGVIREALSIAGGADGTTTQGGAVVSATTDTPAGGLAAGQSTLAAAGTVGLAVRDYRWDYGDTMRQAFLPHLDLDGVVFQSWSDAKLLNVAGWPRESYYFPGDHRGCECDVYPVLRTAESVALAAGLA